MNPRLVIWIGLAMSTVIYFVLAYTFASGGEPDEYQQLARDRYVPVLYGLAGAMFILGWFVVRRVIRNAPEQTRMIMALAVFESCAIFGLLAVFLTKDWRVYLFPWALALIGFIREFPRTAGTAEPPAPM
jgi:predicted permease